ncbi:MAG: hypothetical protein L6R42_002943 [Xanthoria sp. 1 TBL-2021]|nr:MAG: hypothetical protein L6R42_002943 [Xanthoria sp. 1 TBL-2021]
MSTTPCASLNVGPEQEGSDGVLVTRSGRRLVRKPSKRHEPFPFFKLPSEIRNMIYRFALAHGAISKECTHPVGSIGITNIQLRSHRSRTVRSKRRLRSSYQTLNSIFCWECGEYHNRELITATYSLVRSEKLPALGILAVNRQARFEAVPIFYGENIFHFYGMGAVIPFLKDCSLYSRQQIRRLGLFFDVTGHKDGLHQHQIDERAKTFAYIARQLRLSKISLYVNDVTHRFEEALTPVMRDEEWIQAVTQIRDLDELIFDLDFDGIESYCESFLDEWPPSGPTLLLDEAKDKWDEIRDWMVDTEDGYRGYLESKMLKKKQTQLDQWLKHHVCDIQCKDIAKGRAATKDGLPWSDTRGQWTLPDVDLDALYAEAGAEAFTDDSDMDDWSDENSEVTDNDRETESHALKVSCSRTAESTGPLS